MDRSGYGPLQAPEEGGAVNSLPIFSVLQILKALSVPCPSSSSAERDTKGKILCVFQGIGKFILLLGFLYLFVCSLDVLSSAFQLVGGMYPRRQGWEQML